MNVLITGSNGTVGSALKWLLQTKHHNVIAWDRTATPIDDYQAMERYIRAVAPDIVFHLAIPSKTTGKENENYLVHYHWTGELAWITKTLGITFVYTSSVMVFSDSAEGPFTIHSKPDAITGYGYEKRMGEERVAYQNPDALIARLGWQIDYHSGSNNMTDYLDKQMGLEGRIQASTRWYPACSFIEDTAAVLYALASEKKKGVYLIDSNAKWNYCEIINALKYHLNKNWKIIPTDDFIYDQRMTDPRAGMPSLANRLAYLT